MKCKVLAILALVLRCLAAETYAESAPESQRVLRLAAVLALTGDAASHGQAIRRGAELAREELLQLGWRVDLRYYDDQTKIAQTVGAVRLSLAQGFRFFIGPTWSFQVKAAEPLLRTGQALALIPAGSSDINGGSSRALLNLCPKRSAQVPEIVTWLSGRKFRRAAIVTPRGDWGEVHRSIYQQAIVSSGIELASAEEIDYGIDSGTMRIMLGRLKSKHPDVVFITGSAGDIAQLLRIRNELHLNFQVLGTEETRELVALKLVPEQKYLAGAYYTTLPVDAAVGDRFQEKHGVPVSLYADRAYQAVMLLAQAHENTDGSVEAVSAFLVSGRGKLGEKKITFDSDGDLIDPRYSLRSAVEE